jgi:hypothetical protein
MESPHGGIGSPVQPKVREHMHMKGNVKENNRNGKVQIVRHRHKGTGINADFQNATTKAGPSSLQDPRDEKKHTGARRFLNVDLQHVVNQLWGHLLEEAPIQSNG